MANIIFLNLAKTKVFKFFFTTIDETPFLNELFTGKKNK